MLYLIRVVCGKLSFEELRILWGSFIVSVHVMIVAVGVGVGVCSELRQVYAGLTCYMWPKVLCISYLIDISI